jgi:hypothetical protein
MTPAGNLSPWSAGKSFKNRLLFHVRRVQDKEKYRERSLAFSPKMARRSFSSADNSVSPLGVILPTKMSPDFTSAPIRTMPFSSRS